MLLLVPGDVLRPRRPDDHFAPEAAAARELGLPVALVDHDALTRGEARAAVSRVPEAEDAVYRGWMLRSEQYEAFAATLADRGTTLRTSAAQYRRAHELPGWYAALKSLTPMSSWTTGPVWDGFDDALDALGSGAAVLRDYVKSMKHHWDEACFIPEVSDPATARRVAERFVELRDDDLVGGLVLRRFESFTGAEVRTWWVGGSCVLVTAHPDTAESLPPTDVDVTTVAPLVAQLGLPFVTIDLALRSDGVWRVIELGDGQVSDRPSSTDASDLIGVLRPAGGSGE